MKDKLNLILRAFGEYIRGRDDFDIVYSEKIGYIGIQMSCPGDGEPEVLNMPEILNTPEAMLDVLFNEIINDVMFSPDNPRQEHYGSTLTEYEETESRRRITAILETIEGEDKNRYLAFLDRYIREFPSNS